MARHDIEVTEGIGERTSRLGLKKTMQVFGEVDACHMGNRATELPLVRFKTLSAAEAALQALKGGQVFLDGFTLRGNWRGTTHMKRTADPSRDADRRDAEQDLTSRDYMYGFATRRAPSPPRRDRLPPVPMLQDRAPSPHRYGANFGGNFSGGGGGRSRSRKKRRSRSRSRKKPRSSSRRRGGGAGGGARVVPAVVARPTMLKGAAFEENAAAAAAVCDNPLYRPKV
mmetsp:Transcript_24491/g.68106  ORF Transcript_24491/g.68106 Transcript_24491/m.68106 type:complete len:227 (+) Transcript_24491:148-828(+)